MSFSTTFPPTFHTTLSPVDGAQVADYLTSSFNYISNLLNCARKRTVDENITMRQAVIEEVDQRTSFIVELGFVVNSFKNKIIEWCCQINWATYQYFATVVSFIIWISPHVLKAVGYCGSVCNIFSIPGIISAGAVGAATIFANGLYVKFKKDVNDALENLVVTVLEQTPENLEFLKEPAAKIIMGTGIGVYTGITNGVSWYIIGSALSAVGCTTPAGWILGGGALMFGAISGVIGFGLGYSDPRAASRLLTNSTNRHRSREQQNPQDTPVSSLRQRRRVVAASDYPH